MNLGMGHAAHPSVFRRLLGSQLESVEGALFQFSEHPSRAVGTLTVKHHTGKSARFFIWLLRLPKEGQDLPIVVQIISQTGREFWQRVIGASVLQTRHDVVQDWLEEKVGRFRFLHRVTVVEGGLHYRQERVYYCGIRLPRFLSPIVEAYAKGDETGWNLNVTVSCPRCGPICQYQGWITPL